MRQELLQGRKLWQAVIIHIAYKSDKYFMDVPSVPVLIGTTVTFKYHAFFQDTDIFFVFFHSLSV